MFSAVPPPSPLEFQFRTPVAFFYWRTRLAASLVHFQICPSWFAEMQSKRGMLVCTNLDAWDILTATIGTVAEYTSGKSTLIFLLLPWFMVPMLRIPTFQTTLPFTFLVFQSFVFVAVLSFFRSTKNWEIALLLGDRKRRPYIGVRLELEESKKTMGQEAE